MAKTLEQPTVEVRFAAPSKLAGYLTLLARDTMAGANMNDVALALLTAEAERRMTEGYHARVVPTADLKTEESA